MLETGVLTKAALLHDVGKVCLRADHSLGNHSNAGAHFLSAYLFQVHWKENIHDRKRVL